MKSVKEVGDGAKLLECYAGRAKGYAWPLYDDDPNPDSLS